VEVDEVVPEVFETDVRASVVVAEGPELPVVRRLREAEIARRPFMCDLKSQSKIVNKEL
jgi:hypothetical protein